MKRLIFHEDAEVEFKEAVDYYELKSSGLGLDFAADVQARCASIQLRPERFPFYKKTRMQRCLTHRFSYVVFFRVFKDHISIIAVAHVKRRPDYWSHRAVA